VKKSWIPRVLKPVFTLPIIGTLMGKTRAEADYDVIIIGSGGGGMAAAARLSLEGKKVLVIERNDKIGGYMTNFKKGDYFFEVSMHSMDGFNEGFFNRDMFRKLGIFHMVKPIMNDPMYRALYPDYTVEIPADINDYLKLLKEKFPH